MKLQQWKDAAEDFETLIRHYPYFLPSYYLAAQAKTALGEKKAAFQYRSTAYDLEQKKDSLMAARKDSLPHTDLLTAQAQQKRRDTKKEFSLRVAEGQDTEEDKPYHSDTRGSIQKRQTNITNEQNAEISYYAGTSAQKHYHYSIEEYNRERHLPSPVRIVTSPLTLTADMVNTHFEHINTLTQSIKQAEKADTYFARAMEFAAVQDYASAIDDCTQALALMKNNTYNKNAVVIYTFCRANWRYKLLEYQISTGEKQTQYEVGKSGGKADWDFDIMLRDYDYVLQLQPDFVYAAYNKANMLCLQKNFADAIAFYTAAIRSQDDFAEAYFNRGLTYIYTDQTEKGIQDLSKAGELGIYKAYNIITRFQ